MRLAVIGSRTIIDEESVFEVLDSYKYKISVLITGGATGIDQIAEKWALKNAIRTIIYLPDWDKYGKSAGIIRNKLIADDCDQCLAFWDGVSKGTKNTIDLCVKLKKKTNIVAL
jgi:hypothetical protein